MGRKKRNKRNIWTLLLPLGAIVLALTFLLVRIYPEIRRPRLPRHSSAPAPHAQEERSSLGASRVVNKIYFAKIVAGKQRMVAVNRELPPGLGVARASLEELLRGEVPRDCQRPLPAGTDLLGLTVSDGLATVDFNKQLVDGFHGGSDNEQITIYSVVNTLTSLTGVERVQLLVEGKVIQTIGGHHDVSVPLTYDDELVVPYP